MAAETVGAGASSIPYIAKQRNVLDVQAGRQKLQRSRRPAAPG